MMRSALLSGAALALLGVGHAVAADMPVKAPPVVVPYFSWTGFYVGANAGYGWLDSNSTASGSPGVFDPILVAGGSAALASGLALATPSVSPAPAGFIGGGQIGFNRQIGWFVGGIEADIDGAAMRQTTVGSTLVGVPGFPGSSINAAAAASNRLDYLATCSRPVGVRTVSAVAPLCDRWSCHWRCPFEYRWHRSFAGWCRRAHDDNAYGRHVIGHKGRMDHRRRPSTPSPHIGRPRSGALLQPWADQSEHHASKHRDEPRRRRDRFDIRVCKSRLSTQWTGGLARFGVNFGFN